MLCSTSTNLVCMTYHREYVIEIIMINVSRKQFKQYLFTDLAVVLIFSFLFSITVLARVKSVLVLGSETMTLCLQCKQYVNTLFEIVLPCEGSINVNNK